ncbi:hypothetical protein L596_010946 [Steinernema carpocapsae]|uniref:Uncharacterized protein n=1 Tax=Steinernema carpocapsae TaxID=34508 RepID=A0A4U5PJU9_STECR|nr:hypothetical protein L596_010946 [Steinernema carpocapsae]
MRSKRPVDEVSNDQMFQKVCVVTWPIPDACLERGARCPSDSGTPSRQLRELQTPSSFVQGVWPASGRFPVSAIIGI